MKAINIEEPSGRQKNKDKIRERNGIEHKAASKVGPSKKYEQGDISQVKKENNEENRDSSSTSVGAQPRKKRRKSRKGMTVRKNWNKVRATALK